MSVAMSSTTISGLVPTLFEKVPIPRSIGLLSPVLGLMSMRRPATWPSKAEIRSLCITRFSFVESTNPKAAVDRSRLSRW